MESFCESYRFKSLIKDPNCFKNPENPSCIDMILKNSSYLKKESYQNKMLYTKQRNYCVSLLRKSKKNTMPF